MKLIKLLFRLFIAAVILYYAALAAFDHLVEANTGTKVRLGGIRLSLMPAEIELTRVRISNLKGFREPLLAVIPEIFIRVEPAEFFKGRTRISSMRINIQEIVIEKNSENQVNLNELRRILDQKQEAKRGSSSFSFTGTANAAPVSAPENKLIIDRAEFSLSRIIYVDSAKNPPYRKEFVLNIEHQVLENATDPLSVTEQIIGAVLKFSGMKLASAQFDQFLGQAQKAVAGWFK